MRFPRLSGAEHLAEDLSPTWAQSGFPVLPVQRTALKWSSSGVRTCPGSWPATGPTGRAARPCPPTVLVALLRPHPWADHRARPP